jgi:hypothetical protein
MGGLSADLVAREGRADSVRTDAPVGHRANFRFVNQEQTLAIAGWAFIAESPVANAVRVSTVRINNTATLASGTIAELVGLDIVVRKTGAGTVTNAVGLRIDVTGGDANKALDIVGGPVVLAGGNFGITSSVDLGDEIYVQVAAASASPSIGIYRGMGSISTPIAIDTSGRTLGDLDLGGYDGVDYFAGARIRALSAAAWGSADHGTYINFFTTPQGSTTLTERMRITDDGEVRIGGIFRLTSTADAGLGSTTHPFQIGSTSSVNLVIDSNEIMARNNGATSNLELQADGGLVSVGTNTFGGLSCGPNVARVFRVQTTGAVIVGPSDPGGGGFLRIDGAVTIENNQSLRWRNASKTSDLQAFRVAGDADAPLEIAFDGNFSNVVIGPISGQATINVDAPASATDKTILQLDNASNSSPGIFFVTRHDGAHNGADVTHRAYGAGGATWYQQHIGNYSEAFVFTVGSDAGVKALARLGTAGTGAPAGTQDGEIYLYSAADANIYADGAGFGTVNAYLTAAPAGTNYLLRPIYLGADPGGSEQVRVTGAIRLTGQVISTVVTGAAPLVVASTTVVTNLNADSLDGQHGSFYQNAGNLNAGVLLNARVQESNVTQHEAALTILETQITDGAVLARVAGNETISGTWTFSNKVTVNAAGLFTGNLGVGADPLAIIATATHFASVTPKMEIVTGTGTGTYEEGVVIRHNGKDATAVLRRIGLIFKGNSEFNDGESDKMAAIMLESSETHMNNPDLVFVVADAVVMRYDNSVNVWETDQIFRPTAQIRPHVNADEQIRMDHQSSTGSPYISFFQNGTRRSYIRHLDSGNMLNLVSEYGGMDFWTGSGGTATQRIVISQNGDVTNVWQPRVGAYRSGNQSITTSTDTAIQFNAESISDVGTMHDNVTNNTRVTALVAGLYLVIAQAAFAAHATGTRRLQIREDGSTLLSTRIWHTPSGTTSEYMQVHCLWDAAASGYVELMAWQNSGGNLNILGGAEITFLHVIKLW